MSTEHVHRPEADGRGLIINPDSASLPADGSLYRTDATYWLVIAGRIAYVFSGSDHLVELLEPLLSEGDMPADTQPMAFAPIFV